MHLDIAFIVRFNAPYAYHTFSPILFPLTLQTKILRQMLRSPLIIITLRDIPTDILIKNLFNFVFSADSIFHLRFLPLLFPLVETCGLT